MTANDLVNAGKTVWNKGKRSFHPCKVCGKNSRRGNDRSYRQTCSMECEKILKSQIGKKYILPNRLGQRVKTAKHWRITTQGYKELIEGDTPIFRQLEHRRIMEIYLGRKLLFKEHVHHINGNKLDNGIENLLLLTSSEHTRLHAKQNKYATI
jgi:endogenous inhibitor of DNA gyrase (YacG/DUF329 family)